MQETYDPKAVEAAAQRFWTSTRAFEVKERPDQPKYFCLSMLPYPRVRCTWGTCATTPSAT
jgi:leucyl-tRNA synthetase